jgi:uncharacterized protein YggE
MMLHRFTLISLMLAPSLCWGQAGGNIGYSQTGGRNRAEQQERAKRTLTRDEMPQNDTSMFLEANVLMNVKADNYVALFAVSQEGITVAECGQKMETTLRTFLDALKTLGVKSGDIFVDFVAQNKIYGFEVSAEIAKEKLVGFELKKNVSVRFNDYALLDKLVLAASQAQVYDLIKVDYVVRNIPALHTKLMETAAHVIKEKANRYQKLFGIHLVSPPQMVAEKPSLHFPSQLYDSYTAYEAEDVSAGYYRQKYIIQGARKSRTFFFNALDASSFDEVINPVVLEPVVQATLFLKAKYTLQQPAKKEAQGKSKPPSKLRNGSDRGTTRPVP